MSTQESPENLPESPLASTLVSWKKYFRSREFWSILLFSFACLSVLILIVFYIAFPLLTKHASSVVVPDIHQKSFEEAQKIAKQNHLKLEVVDSQQYLPDLPPLTVLKQDPVALEKVKRGRTIYVALNKSTPPQIKIPSIVDMNLLKTRFLNLTGIGF